VLTVELEHLKIETRLTIDKFASATGEYVTEVIVAPSRLRLILKAAVLTRLISPHFDFNAADNECPSTCPNYFRISNHWRKASNIQVKFISSRIKKRRNIRSFFFQKKQNYPQNYPFRISCRYKTTHPAIASSQNYPPSHRLLLVY
jgi:hypothetical protein